MDIIFQVLKNENRVKSYKQALMRGDVTQVYKPWDGANPPDTSYFPMERADEWRLRRELNPQWAFIVVSGLPDSLDFKALKDAVDGSHEGYVTETQKIWPKQYMDMIGNPSKYPRTKNPRNPVNLSNGKVQLDVDVLKTIKRKRFGKARGVELEGEKKQQYLNGCVNLTRSEAEQYFYDKARKKPLSLANLRDRS